MLQKAHDRKQIIEQLNKEVSSLKLELEDSKKKLNSSKARIKVLENENIAIKSKVASQNEKINNDEQYMKHLMVWGRGNLKLVL